MSRFKRATREQLKLRMAIDGPSGSGKTFTALLFALALGKNVAVIDSENGTAKKYQGEVVDDLVFDFFHTDLTNFSPTEYTSVIKEAGREGFDVIVVDSLTHAWTGALELKDQKGGNSFTAWRDITPMHTRMVESILRSPAHVIVTMRSKTEYVLEDEERNGKIVKVPRKIGMAPIQRSGMEYEFDVYCSMDWTHTLKVTKSRCSAIDGVVAVKPGASFMIQIKEWLNSGVRPEVQAAAPAVLRVPIKSDTLNTLKDCYRELAKGGLSATEWSQMLLPFGVAYAKDLSEPDAQELLEQCIAKMTQATAAATAALEPQANGHTKTPEPEATPQASSAPAQMCRPDQAQQIDALFGDLKCDFERAAGGIKKLYGIGIKDGDDIGKLYSMLTAEQANDLIGRLRSKLSGG